MIISAFGLYAFIHIMMNRKQGNLLELKELSGLSSEWKQLYRKTVLDIIAPAFTNLANKGLKEELKGMKYWELEKTAIESAKGVASMMESLANSANETQEAFSNIRQNVLEKIADLKKQT